MKELFNSKSNKAAFDFVFRNKQGVSPMKNITDFTIGRKVGWYYEDTVDKEVVIASEIIGEEKQRVIIDHLIPAGPNKGKFYKEGGYVNIDELYEIDLNQNKDKND